MPPHFFVLLICDARPTDAILAFLLWGVRWNNKFWIVIYVCFICNIVIVCLRTLISIVLYMGIPAISLYNCRLSRDIIKIRLKFVILYFVYILYNLKNEWITK
jgi:hypothetical protein